MAALHAMEHKEFAQQFCAQHIMEIHICVYMEARLQSSGKPPYSGCPSVVVEINADNREIVGFVDEYLCRMVSGKEIEIVVGVGNAGVVDRRQCHSHVSQCRKTADQHIPIFSLHRAPGLLPDRYRVSSGGKPSCIFCRLRYPQGGYRWQW